MKSMTAPVKILFIRLPTAPEIIKTRHNCVSQWLRLKFLAISQTANASRIGAAKIMTAFGIGVLKAVPVL